MRSIMVPALSRALSRVIVTGALASFALAASACGHKEGPQEGPDSSYDISDAGSSLDGSGAPDDAAPSDGGTAEDMVSVDGGTDADAAISDGTTSRDAGDIDIVPDRASMGRDGSIDAAETNDVLLDSVVAMPDAEGGSATPVPVFSECSFVASVGFVPSAIIDTTNDGDIGLSICECTSTQGVTTHRVLCGTYSPSLSIPFYCGGVPLPVHRGIMILDWFACPSSGPLDSGVYQFNERPLTDWDALLAEQIAGHTDGGSDGGATIDGAAD